MTPPDKEPSGLHVSAAAMLGSCRGNEAFLGDLRQVLDQAELAVADHQPSCRACGRCCQFDLTEHRLYVSTGEVALLGEQPPPGPLQPLRCPYQADNQCTARRVRPLGCRTFFCDVNLRDSCRGLYERFHGQIVRLHERHNVPYLYMELTAGLAQAAGTD